MARRVAAGLSVLGVFAVQAQETAVPDAPNANQGAQTAAQVCATCHGADGNSVAPPYPSLAGQHPAYIEKQLLEFKSGARKSAIMGPIVANLSANEIKNIASYFAKQTLQPRAANNKTLVASGQKLYRGGNSASGIPACAACHSPNGAGIPIQYPRLASQHAEYVAGQLRAFRAEERANDANRVMRSIAAKMTDQEMKAVAEYISGLR